MRKRTIGGKFNIDGVLGVQGEGTHSVTYGNGGYIYLACRLLSLSLTIRGQNMTAHFSKIALILSGSSLYATLSPTF